MIRHMEDLCAKHGAKLSSSQFGDKVYYRCNHADDPCFGEEVERSKTVLSPEKKQEAPPSNASSPAERRSSQPTEQLQNDGIAANGYHLNREGRTIAEMAALRVKVYDAVDEWKLAVSQEAFALVQRGERDPEAIWFEIAKRLAKPGLRPPTELAVTEVREEIDAVIARCLQPIEIPEEQPSTIIVEEQETAVVANADYLKREAIVEQLFYTQSISLFVGGKHHGKTTLARTCAMAVMRGVPFLGRAVKQGHVMYAASDDEMAATRMELLRMGWDNDNLSLVRINPEAQDSPERLIMAIADAAKGRGAVLIILDMLFDFAGIRDEMSYAGTREAVGKIQKLADLTGAHVAATHHSPKYMLETITAGQAALGSQGIAARFSPIVLTRKWADGLYTVESTMTRDPRGKELAPVCVEVDSNGWARDAGVFKSWMKWKVYAKRVMALFEGGEPGTEHTVTSVSRELEISRPDAQNALYQLSKANELEREKRGKSSYRYWLPITKENLISRTDEGFELREYGGRSQD